MPSSCLYFFILAILVGRKWRIMVLSCISLMINYAEYFFMYLLTIYMSFLEKYVFIFFDYLKMGLPVELKGFFIYSTFKFLIRYTICKYFFPFCGLPSFSEWYCLWLEAYKFLILVVRFSLGSWVNSDLPVRFLCFQVFLLYSSSL